MRCNNLLAPTPAVEAVDIRLIGRDSNPTLWKRLIGVVVVVQRQANLFEIVLALRPPRRLTSLLHGRQQQRNQDSNNRDHDEQFDQGEATTRE